MSTATMSTHEAEPATLFAKHFKQMTFATHGWEGKRQTRSVQATMAGEAIAGDRATAPRVSLIPDVAEYAFIGTQIRNAREGVYAVLRTHTVGCSSVGARLVPVRNMSNFVAAWGEAVAKFNETADRVVAMHERICQYNYEFWRPRFDSDADYDKEIGRLIPTPERMRAMFSVEHRFTDPDASASGFEDAAVAEFFAEAKANAEKYKQEMIEALVQEPVTKLAEALSAFKLQLDEGKVIKGGSFTAINEAIALCMACTDVIDPETMQKIKDIAGSIDKVAKKAGSVKLNGGNYTQAVKNHKASLTLAIDQVVEACQAEGPQQAMIEKMTMVRALSFDDFGGPDEDD